MMDNDLQQSLRELRSHRKLPEREGGNTGAMKRGKSCLKNLMKALVFRRSQLHCIAANRRSCRRSRSLTFMTERLIRVVSALQDRRVACVAAAEMIRPCVRFGNSAQQKRRTENV